MPSIINKTSGKKIIGKVKFARTFLSRAVGLMFLRRKNFDFGLVFELPEESRIAGTIHMLFVFFPIDAVYLDSHRKVVDIARGLKPFALNYTPKKPAKYLVELPSGFAEVREGDELGW